MHALISRSCGSVGVFSREVCVAQLILRVWECSWSTRIHAWRVRWDLEKVANSLSHTLPGQAARGLPSLCSELLWRPHLLDSPLLFIGVLQNTWQAQAQVCCSLKSLEAGFEECEKMLAGGKSCSWELKIVELSVCTVACAHSVHSLFFWEKSHNWLCLVPFYKLTVVPAKVVGGA